MAFIQDKTVGSGKIKRRILQRHVKAISNSLRELRRVHEKRIGPPADLAITRDQRIVLNHWNTKGRPFKKHKLKHTKTLNRALKQIKSNLKTYTTNQICGSIDRIHTIFQDKEFKFKTNMRGLEPLGISSFFHYEAKIWKQIERLNHRLAADGPMSWFKEGLHKDGMGEMEYLEKKYSYLIEDVNSEVSKTIEDVWIKYRGDNYELRPRDTNTIRRITKKAVSFGEANMAICPPMEVASRIKYMFEQRNYKPKHLGYLVNDRFWQDDFPTEFIKWSGHSWKDIVIP